MPAKSRRFISTSGDYQVSAGGMRGDDGFTSKAVLALRTRLGSMAAFPEFGSRLHEIRTVDERGRKMAEKRAAQALIHLVDSVENLTVQARIESKNIIIYVSGRRGSTEMKARYNATGGA